MKKFDMSEKYDCFPGCSGWDCAMAHSAMTLRKGFSESIATHLRGGMTLRTGIHTTFRRVG